MNQILVSNRHYLYLLKRDFDLKRIKNPLYSLRAYARDLDINISILSLVFSQKRDLSIKSGIKIMDKLKLNALESEMFIDSIIKTYIEKHNHNKLSLQKTGN